MGCQLYKEFHRCTGLSIGPVQESIKYNPVFERSPHCKAQDSILKSQQCNQNIQF